MRQGRARNRDTHFNGQDYDSVQEASIATLLERYIDGFVLENGVTHQVNVGTSSSIDFRIGQTFFEWHPITFRPKDFKSDVAYEQHRNTKMTREEKLELEKVLAGDYHQRRFNLLTEEMQNEPFDLISTQTFGQFYSQVLQRFSSTELPTESEIAKEFGVIQQEVRAQNRDGAKTKNPKRKTLPPS